MAHIKQFRSRYVRVPDPLHPGRYASEERPIPTGAVTLSWEGRTYHADEDGWFQVPTAAAEFYLAFRSPRGARFMTDSDVGEHVRVGTVSADQLPAEEPVAREARPRRAKAPRAR